MLPTCPGGLQRLTAGGFNVMGDQISMGDQEGPRCRLGFQDVMGDHGGLGCDE